MDTLNITSTDCRGFAGGWSLDSRQMFKALQAVRYKRILNILEFGSGAGTGILHNICVKKGVATRYIAYEDNSLYACPDVTTIVYKDFPTEILHLPMPADLVVIDGPHGVSRVKWYPLIKPHVRRGTIIIVDDFLHYKEFGETLDANFSYDAIDEYQEPPKGDGWVTWKTVRVTACK